MYKYKLNKKKIHSGVRTEGGILEWGANFKKSNYYT